MNEKLPPASLTKLMTLYVTSEALAQGQIQLDDKVRVSKEAWSRGDSRMFLKEGSYVTVRELIEGIIVASGNDACVAISQYIGGNEQNFVRLMNQTAKRLGMKDTHFVDSTGLPRPGHYSTAYDLALLTRALINNFPQYYGWYKQKWITYNNIKQPNRNRLLWRDPSVDGLKTGHTNAAGYCLISSAKRNGMRLISVMMGTPSDTARSNDSQALLNWGYRYYHTYKLFKANTPLTKARVYLAKQKEIELGITRDLYVTIPSGQYKFIKAKIAIQPKLKAPVIKGHTYGHIQVYLKGNLIAKVLLVALSGDPLAGWFSRSIDHIELFFKNII
jgi:D-alanyl-D-alanine carboxypeptidase (penicillin-binding protein 5/6)